ncbi:HAD family hydrolase [Limibaculum sp. FT325]|uniref:HAD family hydrolase n=1 Tax=Thermohalobaculum sediminis TaxID=2939436 RepID=UPI0020C11B13|nr:HAD family hydrolase [Limibaculum sediminis]MCL5778258.1 HAD family hydrolase [Limibaculum sediminis]
MTDPAADRRPESPLAGARLVLATDLDGTFLGGADGARRALYDWIETHRAGIGLVFVTGREPRFIERLCAGEEGMPVPWPDYVIGDVGTTIAEVLPPGMGQRVRPIPALEAEISRAWAGKGERVRTLLEGHPGLTIQDVEFRHRVSYHYDPAAYCATAEAKVARLGLDHLVSDGRFFDVLPRGVSKGPSLRRLIDHLGVSTERVLVAGDTLNDLSMLEAGLKGVAVGGSEPALLDRLRGRPGVYSAVRPGAAGIAEAIAVFDLFTPLPTDTGGPDAL